MSFLKDFKEDLTLAVNELLPQEEKEEDILQLEDFPEKEISSEISSIEKRQQAQKLSEPKGQSIKTQEPKLSDRKPEESRGKEKNRLKNNGRKNQRQHTSESDSENVEFDGKKSQIDKEKGKGEVKKENNAEEQAAKILLHKEKTPEEKSLEGLLSKRPAPEKRALKQTIPELQRQDTMEMKMKETNRKENNKIEIVEAENTMDEMMTETLEKEMEELGSMDVIPEMEIDMPTAESKRKSGEVATITAGTRINGDIESDGSLEILGTITGNVTCNGKLTITGTIVGNSNADEVYADSAKVEGEINSAGAVKIGLGSVILGNVNATSAVVAGAIRGDIDVHGPVIVDTSAVVMGNIKSRSVQINNGAVIEGFCSQCYSDVSVKNFFEENKPSEKKKD